jgi:hypothetical protein
MFEQVNHVQHDKVVNEESVGPLKADCVSDTEQNLQHIRQESAAGVRGASFIPSQRAVEHNDIGLEILHGKVPHMAHGSDPDSIVIRVAQPVPSSRASSRRSTSVPSGPSRDRSPHSTSASSQRSVSPSHPQQNRRVRHELGHDVRGRAWHPVRPSSPSLYQFAHRPPPLNGSARFGMPPPQPSVEAPSDRGHRAQSAASPSQAAFIDTDRAQSAGIFRASHDILRRGLGLDTERAPRHIIRWGAQTARVTRPNTARLLHEERRRQVLASAVSERSRGVSPEPTLRAETFAKERAQLRRQKVRNDRVAVANYITAPTCLLFRGAGHVVISDDGLDALSLIGGSVGSTIAMLHELGGIRMLRYENMEQLLSDMQISQKMKEDGTGDSMKGLSLSGSRPPPPRPPSARTKGWF